MTVFPLIFSAIRALDLHTGSRGIKEYGDLASRYANLDSRNHEHIWPHLLRDNNRRVPNKEFSDVYHSVVYSVGYQLHAA